LPGEPTTLHTHTFPSAASSVTSSEVSSCWPSPETPAAVTVYRHDPESEKNPNEGAIVEAASAATITARAILVRRLMPELPGAGRGRRAGRPPRRNGRTCTRPGPR